MFSNLFNYYLVALIAIGVFLSLLFWMGKIKSSQALLFMLLIFLVPLLAGYIYVTYYFSIPEVTVPELSGEKIEEAFVKLENLKLRGRHAGSVFNMKLPEGSIVSQSPEGGRLVKRGRVISVITSSGKQKVSVPNLLGRPAEQAAAVLTAEGLILGKIEKDYTPEIDSGIILTQNPLPGEQVDIGFAVEITISSSEESEDPGLFEEEEGE